MNATDDLVRSSASSRARSTTSSRSRSRARSIETDWKVSNCSQKPASRWLTVSIGSTPPWRLYQRVAVMGSRNATLCPAGQGRSRHARYSSSSQRFEYVRGRQRLFQWYSQEMPGCGRWVDEPGTYRAARLQRVGTAARGSHPVGARPTGAARSIDGTVDPGRDGPAWD